VATLAFAHTAAAGPGGELEEAKVFLTGGPLDTQCTNFLEYSTNAAGDGPAAYAVSLGATSYDCSCDGFFANDYPGDCPESEHNMYYDSATCASDTYAAKMARMKEARAFCDSAGFYDTTYEFLDGLHLPCAMLVINTQCKYSFSDGFTGQPEKVMAIASRAQAVSDTQYSSDIVGKGGCNKLSKVATQPPNLCEAKIAPYSTPSVSATTAGDYAKMSMAKQMLGGMLFKSQELGGIGVNATWADAMTFIFACDDIVLPFVQTTAGSQAAEAFWGEGSTVSLNDMIAANVKGAMLKVQNSCAGSDDAVLQYNDADYLALLDSAYTDGQLTAVEYLINLQGERLMSNFGNIPSGASLQCACTKGLPVMATQCAAMAALAAKGGGAGGGAGSPGRRLQSGVTVGGKVLMAKDAGLLTQCSYNPVLFDNWEATLAVRQIAEDAKPPPGSSSLKCCYAIDEDEECLSLNGVKSALLQQPATADDAALERLWYPFANGMMGTEIINANLYSVPGHYGRGLFVTEQRLYCAAAAGGTYVEVPIVPDLSDEKPEMCGDIKEDYGARCCGRSIDTTLWDNKTFVKLIESSR
jgi:hypothetical protein